MDSTWQIAKWIWVALCSAFFIVQVVALWRLKGEKRKRSGNVVWLVWLPLFVCGVIRDLFEWPLIRKVEIVVVGAAALVGTFILVRMLRDSSSAAIATGQDGDEDRQIQLLKLN
jgi:hypothetical protein